ncbi:MAG TPA: MFS transporter [Mycobacteriales bacterium]|nr:MFS transporter [Mycobacteriales bacterium]
MTEVTPPDDPAPEPRRRRLVADLSPLRENPTYRRWWAGYTVSNVGNQITIVAAQLQVFHITHSSFYVGITGLVTVVPLIVFGLFGGSIADAVDRRKLMLLTSSLLWGTSALLLVQALTHLNRLSVIYVLLGLQAGVSSVDSAARGATLPRLVRMELLPAANSLGQLGWNTALTAGPLIAGLVVGVAGYGAAYGIDVVSFAGVFYGVYRLPPILPDSTTHRAGFKSVAEGLRFLAPRKNLMMTFLVDIDAMVFGMPRALFPALAAGAFHGGAETAGFLYAAPSIGAFLGAAFSGWAGHVRRQGFAVIVSIVIWGASIALFGLVHVLWLGVVLLAVAGAADMVSAIFRSTILQVATPDHLRGRLQGVFTVVVAGGPRIGDLESGSVASLVSNEFSVISGGIACIVGVLTLAARYPSFAKYDATEPIP